jgi:hypothetical protein
MKQAKIDLSKWKVVGYYDTLKEYYTQNAEYNNSVQR